MQPNRTLSDPDEKPLPQSRIFVCRRGDARYQRPDIVMHWKSSHTDR